MSKDSPQDYKGNGNHKWEKVFSRIVVETETDGVADVVGRLRVPGGWLYRNIAFINRTQVVSHVVFVPMPEVVTHKV